jgi:hypothetical protein
MRLADKWTVNHTHIFWHYLLLYRVIHVSVYSQTIIRHWHKNYEKNKNLQHISYFYHLKYIIISQTQLFICYQLCI